MVSLEYNYYNSIDTVNMEFKKDYNYFNTIELEHGINLDFDDIHNPVNLEIDSASKYLNINKKQLLKPKIKVEININNDVKVKIEFLFKNKSKRILNLKTTPNSLINPSQNTFIY